MPWLSVAPKKGRDLAESQNPLIVPPSSIGLAASLPSPCG
jgi:hypothetical protein